jgi:carbon-monoxide dehydrogenase medium subunit
MISQEFAFFAPKTVTEAVALLDEHAEDGKLLAGGMSLVPAMNLGLARPTAIVSLNHVSGLDYVEEGPSSVRIGSMVRHARVERDPVIRRWFPLLSQAAAQIGDVQVRNRGTIGGSIAHADPAADYLPVMVALAATFTVAGREGERKIPAREFFRGVMDTALAPAELLTEIELPKLPEGSGSAYLRLARLEGSFPIANAAAVVTGPRPIVAVGGATAAPVLLDVPVEFDGGDPQEGLAQVEAAARDACTHAFSDLSATAEYRQAMAGVYARRAVEAALAARR